MAEGNANLKKQTEVNMNEGQGYRDMLNVADRKFTECVDKLREIEDSHSKSLEEIKALHIDLENLRSVPSVEVGESERLLEEIDSQERKLEEDYKVAKDQAESVARKVKMDIAELEKRIRSFGTEQDEASRSPIHFVTKEVLKAHSEFKGEDFSNKQGDIIEAVGKEGDLRAYLKRVESWLPKKEECLVSFETAFSSFEKILSDSDHQMYADAESFERDLDGPLTETIKAQLALIDKAKNPGWFGRKKAEEEAKQAFETLRTLKDDKIKEIKNLFGRYQNIIVQIYQDITYEVRGRKTFSINTFVNDFDIGEIKSWKDLSLKYPDRFSEEQKVKIEDLLKRGGEIDGRRDKINTEYERLFRLIGVMYQKLDGKIEGLFKTS